MEEREKEKEREHEQKKTATSEKERFSLSLSFGVFFSSPHLQVPDLRRDVHMEPLELLGLDLERGELGLLLLLLFLRCFFCRGRRSRLSKKESNAIEFLFARAWLRWTSFTLSISLINTRKADFVP